MGSFIVGKEQKRRMNVYLPETALMALQRIARQMHEEGKIYVIKNDGTPNQSRVIQFLIQEADEKLAQNGSRV